MTQGGADGPSAPQSVPSRAPAGPASRLSLWFPVIYALASGAALALSAALPETPATRAWRVAGHVAFIAVAALALHASLRWALARERRVRREIERTARRYELLADHSRDVILFVRRDDGRILDANAAATAAYGWSPEELRRMSVFDLRGPGTAEIVASQLAEAADRGIRFEAVHRRKDGASFPVEVRSQGAIIDGVRGLVSVVRDATERKATEEALRESEERLALAVEAAGLGMFHAVPYGPMEWSPRCKEIFGVGDALIPDFDAFLRLVHPDDRERVREDAVGWLDPKGGGRYHGQYRCVRPDGSLRWVAASGSARFVEENGVRRAVQIVGALLDITDLKAAQAQVMQADRLASVGILAAGVAHEINNPLTYVISALDYLGEHVPDFTAAPLPPSKEVTEALAEARDGAERVRRVVRDLRTFSGMREERRTRVWIEEVVESATHLAANEIRYRARLERERRIAPVVLGDEARLGQVVLNLLINAAQAIPEGHPAENEIRVVTGMDERGYALLEVHDTGTGIAPEIADRIFDPFFTTKPRGIGTGLGLSICRNIVLGLGGEISAEPRPGGGTRMHVALPAALPGEEKTDRSAPSAVGTQRRGRVLVVDDEPAVAAALGRLLASEHEVELRTRAEDALDAITRGERFDAILCDLVMPEMTGMDLHASLERVAPEQARRMIVLTAGAFTETAREFLDRMDLPRCDKPLDAPTLREMVRRLVG